MTASAPDLGATLSAGWEIYKKEPLLLSGATLLMAVINAVASWIPFANLLTSTPLLAGMYFMVMRIDRGESVDISVLFKGFNHLVPLVISAVLVGLFVAIGIFLLVLPGIYLALAYGFTTLKIIDGGFDFWPAMESSRKLINTVFMQYLVLSLILLLICFLGAIPFGLGLLVAIPVAVAAHYRFYNAIT